MRRTAFITAAIALAAPAHAFQAVPCGPEFHPITITEPWEDNSQVFANGAIRIFEIFIDPNVASGAALGILHPVPTEEGAGFRRCTAILQEGDFRYYGQAHVMEATAVYDASVGLVITVPISLVGSGDRVFVRFAVNQASGYVTIL